ncbi:MAG TPA: divalent metal cation transporter [Thermoanaerobaculia bacterium]|jgi:Mn2+/Fe2+ NRAMP family transporter|nr:divalent metal cation transporter [Thermoanaerobaculia bacterium]
MDEQKKQDEETTARQFLAALGPGIVTGAADDDPSGIATYSIAGAQLGTSMLWTAFLTWPLMAAVQMMCARIGMVSGHGLAHGLRRKFPRPVVAVIALALLIANTVNIGADLAAMADAAQMLTGLNSHLYVILFGIGISGATVWLRYGQIANTLKWLALFLFAYIVTAFILRPAWTPILRDAIRPLMPHGPTAWATLVAILGTTISPYLFFWQASQEVEEEKFMGRVLTAQRIGASDREIVHRKFDIGVGTFFSNAVMFFIIVTTAITLHRHGITNIETSRQAAEALRPLAGAGCYLLFTAGLIGTGLLAIPTLSGSAAYALAETFGWHHGLDEKIDKARAFYAVVLLSMAIGIALDFADINPVRALYWTAVINGVLAPFLLLGILLVASDRKIMHGQPSSALGRVTVAATMLLMFGACVGMFVF